MIYNDIYLNQLKESVYSFKKRQKRTAKNKSN